MPVFNDIKTIFNNAMTASQNNVGPVNLQNKHASANFPNLGGNFTKAELLAAVARGVPFFQPGVIPPPGVVGTQGDQANLVKALLGQATLPTGAPVRSMPGGGPAVPPADIATIVDWINHGCPD
jgi:hypothetical protein